MRTKYSIINSITSIVNNLITIIFVFVNKGLLIHALGIEYSGLNGLFSDLLTFIGLFEFGFGGVFTYKLYKVVYKDEKEKIRSLYYYNKKICYIIFAVMLLIGLLLVPFIGFIVRDNSININIVVIYLLAMFSLASTYVINYKRNIIIAHQKNYIINIIHLIYIVLLNAVQILILIFVKNYYLYLLVKLICIWIENLLISNRVKKIYPYLLDKNYKEIDKKTKNEITVKVKSTIVHKVSATITYGTDNILLSIFFGLTTLGIYTNYYYIINSVDTLFRNFVASSNSSIGNLLVEKDYEKNYQIFKKIQFLNLWITLFTASSLLVLTEPFITLWIGYIYLLPKYILIILIINYFQSMMRTPFNLFKEAAGIWIEDRNVAIAESIINIVFSLILLHFIGIAGVFLGTFISSFVLWFYSYPKFIYKNLLKKNYKKYYLDLLINVSVFILIIGIAYLIKIISINNLILCFIIKLILVIIIPNIMLMIIFRKNECFKYYIDLIKNRIIKGNKMVTS